MMEFAALWVMGMAKISRIAIMEALTAFVIVMSAKACRTWPTREAITLIIHTETIRTVAARIRFTFVSIRMERTTMIRLSCWRRWVTTVATITINTCTWFVIARCWYNWRIRINAWVNRRIWIIVIVIVGFAWWAYILRLCFLCFLS